MFDVRTLSTTDLPDAASLLKQYTREVLNVETPVTEDALARDGFGSRFTMIVAERRLDGRIVGFAAWQDSYDLHWGIRGGEVIDMYVRPECRGYGIAPRMLNLAAKQIHLRGGTFMKRQGLYGGTQPSKLYQRIAIGCPGVDCILGGRAFRAFAGLPGDSLRELIRNLPKKEWNYLP